MLRILVCLVLIASCADASLSDARGVFAGESRVAMTSTAYPWSAIGRLSTRCTGTMVAPDLVLTAAHCIFDDAGNWQEGGNIQFYANYNAGSYLASGNVIHAWWGTRDTHGEPEQDWAILRLDQRVGVHTGWLGIRDYEFSSGDRVALAGYGFNFRDGEVGGIDTNCQVHDEDERYLLHDCDAWGGNSGGPLLGYFGNEDAFFILGVHVRGFEDHFDDYRHDRANLAVPSSRILSRLRSLVLD